MSTQPKTKPAPTDWQPSDAAELYRIPSWGDPFFFVNDKGHMAVRALDEEGTTMDVVDIVNELRRRGVQFPVLLRFQDVLRAHGVTLRARERNSAARRSSRPTR
jgi:arginine decarboxylase